MMIAKKALCLTCCALSLWSGLMLSGRAANNLHFKGQLLSSACTLVVTGNTLADVVFPQMSVPDLTRQRQSAHIPFSLQLAECNSALGTGVSVRFSGVEVVGMAGFLALEGQSIAKGVGIGIETSTGTQVMVNGTTDTIFPLTDGLNTLNFNAWVQAINGEVITPGTFSATTTVAFEYL